ncbi:MAG TPA: alpha/beta hydrolase [Candidatus Dormibacteraeota bacterium]|nr:alpha/beta hydrolase [Candidatus Dormibacteraeota bacterium]
MTQFFTVNGTRYAADLRGSGPAIVALHAGIATRHMYDQLLADLETDHRVLVYDQPGFGESEVPAGPISPPRELLSLMDQAEMPDAVLVGTSFGCLVAFDAALAAPDRVRAIVAAGAGLSGRSAPDDLQQAFQEIDRAAEAGDLELANELEMRIWMDGDGRSDPVDAGVRAAVAAMNLTVLEAAAAGREAEELEPDVLAAEHLSELRCPVLVVMGANDQPHCRETAHLISEQVPNARLVTIPAAAHLPSLEQPDEFNRLVREFVASLV